jgi:hypothetical protein
MKELTNIAPVEIHQEAEKKQEYKFFGSFVLKTGCKLYSYDPDSMDGRVKEVVIKKVSTAVYSGSPKNKLTCETQVNNTAQHNSLFIYFQAINEKNAVRKLKRWLAGDYSIAESFEEREKPAILPY